MNKSIPPVSFSPPTDAEVDIKEAAHGLALLRKPFPAHQISQLPKPYKRDSAKGTCKECGGYHGLPAAHLDYVGHAALTDRLLEADPEWNWEPLAVDEHGLPRFDHDGGLWINLMVCGMTRLGYGNAEAKPYMDAGARTKEVIGDAMRNAAMRFGAALDLWHKGELHKEPDNGNGSAAEEMIGDPIAEAFAGADSLEAIRKIWGKLPKPDMEKYTNVKDLAKKRVEGL